MRLTINKPRIQTQSNFFIVYKGCILSGIGDYRPFRIALFFFSEFCMPSKENIVLTWLSIKNIRFCRLSCWFLITKRAINLAVSTYKRCGFSPDPVTSERQCHAGTIFREVAKCDQAWGFNLAVFQQNLPGYVIELGRLIDYCRCVKLSILY